MRNLMRKTNFFGILVLPLLIFSFSFAIDNIQKKEFFSAIIKNDVKKVQELIDDGINVNSTNEKNGWTALHYAADKGRAKIAKILIENGADIDRRDVKGRTPLHIAAIKGNVKVAKVLLNYGADPNVLDAKGKRPLDYSLENQRKALVVLLTETLPEEEQDQEKLFIAVKNCDLKKTKKLLNKIDVNVRDRNFRTPIFYAIKNCKPQFIKYLISRGANINVYDRDSLTPLIYAIMRKDIKIVKLLIEHGAKIKQEDLTEVSPLLAAVSLNEADVVKLLLKAGANPNEIAVVEGFTGMYIFTPLDIAEKKGYKKIAQILRKHGAKRYKEFSQEQIQELIGRR